MVEYGGGGLREARETQTRRRIHNLSLEILPSYLFGAERTPRYRLEADGRRASGQPHDLAGRL